MKICWGSEPRIGKYGSFPFVCLFFWSRPSLRTTTTSINVWTTCPSIGFYRLRSSKFWRRRRALGSCNTHREIGKRESAHRDYSSWDCWTVYRQSETGTLVALHSIHPRSPVSKGRSFIGRRRKEYLSLYHPLRILLYPLFPVGYNLLTISYPL